MTAALLAHGGHVHAQSGDSWWLAWNWSPIIVVNLTIIAVLYSLGWRKARARGGNPAGAAPWQLFSFIGGMAFLVLALLSPIDPLSDVYAWVHMIQHSLLMMAAAPLFVLGAPAYVMLWALPAGARRWWLSRQAALEGRAHPALRPLGAWAIYAVTLWLWHVPYLYEAALDDQWIHDFQHLSFFVTSAFFWWVLFHPRPGIRLDYGIGILYLFVASLHSMALGALMAVSPEVWYPHYVQMAREVGFDALSDQQLAGYIMWMPAGISYILAAAVLFLFWLSPRKMQWSR